MTIKDDAMRRDMIRHPKMGVFVCLILMFIHPIHSARVLMITLLREEYDSE